MLKVIRQKTTEETWDINAFRTMQLLVDKLYGLIDSMQLIELLHLNHQKTKG